MSYDFGALHFPSCCQNLSSEFSTETSKKTEISPVACLDMINNNGADQSVRMLCTFVVLFANPEDRFSRIET